MSYILFLDDMRNPSDVTWVYFPRSAEDTIIARNIEEFTSYITEHGVPKFVCFDHDLADSHYGDQNCEYSDEKTGYHCAKFLVDYCHDNDLSFPDYVIHSMNPVGKENIIQYINSAKRNNYIQ